MAKIVVKGFDEAMARLERLETRTARKTLKKALRKAGAPIAQAYRKNLPVQRPGEFPLNRGPSNSKGIKRQVSTRVTTIKGRYRDSHGATIASTGFVMRVAARWPGGAHANLLEYGNTRATHKVFGRDTGERLKGGLYLDRAIRQNERRAIQILMSELIKDA